MTRHHRLALGADAKWRRFRQKRICKMYTGAPCFTVMLLHKFDLRRRWHRLNSVLSRHNQCDDLPSTESYLMVLLLVVLLMLLQQLMFTNNLCASCSFCIAVYLPVLLQYLVLLPGSHGTRC